MESQPAKERKEIWMCEVVFTAQKEIYSSKTKGIKLSHLSKQYKTQRLFIGNNEDERADPTLNRYSISNLESMASGKYGAKVKILSVKKLTYHGLTNYKV